MLFRIIDMNRYSHIDFRLARHFPDDLLQGISFA